MKLPARVFCYALMFFGVVGIFSPNQMLYGVSASSNGVIAGTDFEDGLLTGWDIGPQTGTLNGTVISGSGTGVNIFGPSSLTFNAPARGGTGSPTLSNGAPNPYYQPAVVATAWTFGPFGSKAASLQPSDGTQFDTATSALGLSSAENAAIKTLMSQQATASTYGNGIPTNSSWITRDVTLNAGVTYTMSWNYVGTDYVPYNDGSITSLVFTGSGTAPIITVNNSVSRYALLGFTNPGTGDYSTGTYGSTGWQIATYQVSTTGQYKLGFAVFNLDDMSLSPVLMIDSQPGSTTKNGQSFGAVVPNNPNAPVVTTTPATSAPSTTTGAPTTTTEPATTTTTVPAPPVTEQPLPPTTLPQEPPTTDGALPIDAQLPPTSLPVTGNPIGMEFVFFSVALAVTGVSVRIIIRTLGRK